ncbi:ATP-binding protein [Halobacteriovorax sp. HLS]|uniref:ATP-binding protein n=1 Tax=Halobacteriovorax sp. HLS TaxID=2234000 RepID=UPI0013E2CF7F|nr:ATP-binding protein [Halobacteriovorax sp. HLS]
MSNIKKNDLQNSLSKKFLKITIYSYIAITAIITIIQLSMTYFNTQERISYEIKQIPQSYGPSIGAAIWSFNDDALVSSVNGLLEKDMISGVNVQYSSEEISVGIVKKNGHYYSYEFSGTDDTAKKLSGNLNFLEEFKFPIVFKTVQKELHTVGIMTIYVSKEVFYKEIKRSLILVVTNSVLILVFLILISSIFLKRIISNPLEQLVSEIDKVSFSNLDESFLVSTHSTSDDEIRHLEHSFNNLISKLIVSKQEISQLTSGLESQIEERTADLIGALEQAKTSSKAKSQFLANMSHELRTPLNAITGFSAVLMEDLQKMNLSKEYIDNLSNIHQSSIHLTQVVSDILSLSKIESGKMKLDISSCSLKEVCNSVFSMTEHFAKEKNIEYNYSFSDDCDFVCDTDETKIKQVLLNLISNAIKFTPKEGSISFNIKRDKLDNILVEVIDTGIGIEASKIDVIFKEFEQAEMSTTKKFGGTGLGLSISKKLVTMLGGSLEVTSVVSKGSTFSVILPLKPIDNIQNNVENEIDYSIDGLDFLVFEDNKLNQKLIGTLLKRSGATCTLACDGLDGLEKLKLKRPDVILMDLHMPNMNGLQATVEIRKKFSSSELPIFALSADIMEESIIETKKAGMNGFLSKPVQMKELKKQVSLESKKAST